MQTWKQSVLRYIESYYNNLLRILKRLNGEVENKKFNETQKQDF